MPLFIGSVNDFCAVHSREVFRLLHECLGGSVPLGP